MNNDIGPEQIDEINGHLYSKMRSTPGRLYGLRKSTQGCYIPKTRVITSRQLVRESYMCASKVF